MQKSDRERGTVLPSFVSLGCAFPKPHPGAPAVLVDELDTGAPESGLDSCDRCGITNVTARFNIGNRVSMEAGCLREVSDGPI
jgi:hypothetical protein